MCLPSQIEADDTKNGGQVYDRTLGASLSTGQHSALLLSGVIMVKGLGNHRDCRDLHFSTVQ